MTTRRSVLGIGLLGFGSIVGMQACSLASPTTINVQPGVDDGDGGASSTKAPMSTPAGGGATAACGTNDFVKADLAKLTVCGDGKGHCFDKAKTPFSDKLVACADASMVCVPDEVLEAGGGKLKSCTFFLGNKPGACLTATLVPEIIEKSAGALKPDVCDPDQLCLPCADPTNNDAPTGFCEPIGVHEKACAAPGAGGDAGTPASTAQPCCTTNGKSNGVCLDEKVVPEAERDSTKQDTCAVANKCVPAAFVAGKPVKCGGGLLGAGVCMDKCFNGMMSLAGDIGLLSEEGCGETEVCVPCRFMKGKNVPGCAQ